MFYWEINIIFSLESVLTFYLNKIIELFFKTILILTKTLLFKKRLAQCLIRLS